ncbi:nucleus accumbens-associated protein 2 [Megalops cyprinoides]|uniref:nucleus accumbens-associated protein 2 n=1 Tax=Megalops cyprinoides TaxID=118141 RepID=UPI0018644358|nr:nucleus accumbens-associated protein 2 [Megalops cyprinoides]XP_036383047.1 nucleus accumbens-associated protein 2 [Megalops cyprinoides]
MAQLMHVEIPNFGSTVLGSLNEQRLQGQYCDVSILVNGQTFRAHRAVLAASSLYFRDLFSGSSKAQFELPSSVAPACFGEILSFCYTGKLTMAASEQLVVMYTAGYLQIQHIVERGMDLMFKANSPHCDSQTVAPDDPGSAPHSPTHLPAPPLGPPGWSPSVPVSGRRIKQEAPEPPIGVPGVAQRRGEGGALGGRLQRGSSLFYAGVGGGAIFPGLQPYPLPSGGGSSPGASSLPTTDSPTSYQNEEEEFEEEPYDGGVGEDAYGQLYGRSASYGGQDKSEVSAIPLALESRSCVLIRRDLVALPASLISQIGYRCHPKLYTEGDPGEKLELVAGTGVFMTRGQLMNCHLCAGIKHKVLLRRLLATFFDRNTLANSCGTGIRSSTSDPSRKPLDSRVLNAVKLYCQSFAPNFKESEMNVIAADMCTNARRVRKRWLPKIKSMLPDSMEVYRSGASLGVAHLVGGSQASLTLPFEADFKGLMPSGLTFEQRLYGEHKETHRTHLQLAGGSPGAGPVAEGVEPEIGGVQAEEEAEEEEEEGVSLETPEGTAAVTPLSPGDGAGGEGGGGCQPPTPDGQQGEESGGGLRGSGQ